MLSVLHSGVLWCIILLLGQSFGAPASGNSQPSLFAPSLNSSSFLDFSGLPILPTNSTPSLGDIEHWTYEIPSTTLLLRIAGYPPHRLDRRALGRTILGAQAKVRAHLKEHGDGYLWEGDDPFEQPSPRFASISLVNLGIASPAVTPGAGTFKLQYGMVNDILRGLWNFMFLNKNEWEIMFKIEDKSREVRREGEELVGLGKVMRGMIG